MDYGRLISDAWRLTWRHKYLWILGLFAAETGGCGGSFGGSPGSSRFTPPTWTSDRSPAEVESWVTGHWAFLAAVLVGIIVIALVLLVLSVITAAALVTGVDEAAASVPGAGLGSAWRRGATCFWRMLGMWLLVGLIVAAVIVALVAALIVPVAVSSSGGDGPGGGVIAVWVLLALLLVAILIPVSIAVAIGLQWAARSLVLEDTGVMASLRAGFTLLRRNVGSSLLVWLIAIVLSVVVGIAMFAILAAAGIPAAVLLARSWGDVGPAVMAGVALLGVIALAALALVHSVSTTYFSAYWTLAYRQVTAPRVPALAGGPGAWPPQAWPPPPAQPQHWPPQSPPPHGWPSQPPPPQGPSA